MWLKFAQSFFITTIWAHHNNSADVAKLVDALDLGSSASRRVGSTPSIRTHTPPVTFQSLKGLIGGF